MIEMRSRLGGCRKGGGSKQQTGLQFLSLAAGRDKGPVEFRTLCLPVGRDKSWSPVCCFDPPPLLTTTAHITPRFHPRYGNPRHVEGFHGFWKGCYGNVVVGFCRVLWVLKVFVWNCQAFSLDIERFEKDLGGF